jgi:hypothetical protein
MTEKKSLDDAIKFVHKLIRLRSKGKIPYSPFSFTGRNPIQHPRIPPETLSIEEKNPDRKFFLLKRKNFSFRFPA